MRFVAVALLISVAACGDTREDCCNVSLTIIVPEETGTVYLSGNLPELGPWAPDGLAMDGEGSKRTASIHIPIGFDFEYKFTLGSWDREMLNASGAVPENFRLRVNGDKTVHHDISQFKRDPLEYFADWKASGVKGRMLFWTNVESAFLGPSRHVEIWLPPGYDDNETKRYPVLYMHDGQNLFDPRRANTGVDWGVDEAMVRLTEAGVISPAIVVGVWSTADRGPEYSPWHGAPDYARFLIEELKPRVDMEFRTLTGPENTAVMGASMGGLLSFFLVTYHPEVFGSCGCMSTHFPLSEAVMGTGGRDRTPYILRDIDNDLAAPAGVRYWFDYGGKGLDASYGKTHKAVRDWLLAQGKVENTDFVIRKYAKADHNESSWRARLDDPLRFLFAVQR
ncbi:MAG: alpha/beta hydrolase-fold protein [Gammaproteobacteria bacterium]|nr:alpha/beta hydrolase-fold protein [Gammaproteobacteria bacterium]